MRRAVPTDLMVILEDRPGELARLGDITGAAGVNIRGLAAFTGEGRGVIHLLVDDDAAARATEALRIPTIGIGAGPHCSGQVLVLHDVLGLIQGHKAKFVRTYVDGYGLLQDALSRWAEDVRGGAFPGPEESYGLPEAARAAVAAWQAPAAE
jgi:hypothetical protein